MNIAPYKNYQVAPAVGGNGAPTQNWPFIEDVQQNPWWIINRNTNEDDRNRIIVNVSVKYDFVPWFSLQVRGKRRPHR
jgi:hypothetical protein